MKLLLKIHSKDRHHLNLQRKPGRNNQNRGLPSTGEQPSVLRQERYFLYGALILFVIIAFSTALYFVINHMQSDPTPNQPPILFGDSYASGTK